MREQAGSITRASGVVLLLKSNFNPDQMAMYFNYLVGSYRPAILIIIDPFPANPRKREIRGRSRQVPLDKNGVFYIIREQKASDNTKRTYFIDPDGTIYHGSQIIGGAKEFIDTSTKRGGRFVFLMNNAKRIKRQNVEHTEQMGFTGIQEEHFFTSSMAVVRYAVAHHEGRNVWYIGQDGLGEVLEGSGFIVTGRDADLAFVGLDNAGTYEKYSKTLDFPLKGAELIGTNSDRLLVQLGGFAVGNGSIVVMFECASGQVSPKIGELHASILEEALKYFQLNVDEAMILGGGLETDILLGVENHVDTTFVTSGVHQCEGVEKLQIHSTRAIDDLRELPAE